MILSQQQTLQYGNTLHELLSTYLVLDVMDGQKRRRNAVHRFCLRHNILLKDSYGLRACTVVVHNLIYLKDCVHRFGSLDNYWCYVFERAV